MSSNPKIKKRDFIFPDRPPELAENGNMIKLGDEIGYQGSIIKVEHPPNTPFWHYGLIYGYDKKKRLWIIDNTAKGVLFTDFRVFTNFGKLNYEIELMTDPERSESIIGRAKEFIIKRKFFNLKKNNCEIFVNYAHGEIETPESNQIKVTQIIANFFINIAEGIYLTATKNDPEKYKNIKGSFEKLRKVTFD